jgi:hypothetical protein
MTIGTDPHQEAVYVIRLRGHLSLHWKGSFGPMTITPEDNGDTILTGPIVDQAALHGVLTKVRDLGLPLLSLTRIDPGINHGKATP